MNLLTREVLFGSDAWPNHLARGHEICPWPPLVSFSIGPKPIPKIKPKLDLDPLSCTWSHFLLDLDPKQTEYIPCRAWSHFLLGPNPTPKTHFLVSWTLLLSKLQSARKWRKMAELNTGGEISPNMTIYINNLNEKIKLEGDSFIIISFVSSWYSFCPNSAVLQSWRNRFSPCSLSSEK